MKLQVTDPDSIKFTLIATFTLAEWRDLRDKLNSSNSLAGNAFQSKIVDMIIQAQEAFYPKEK